MAVSGRCGGGVAAGRGGDVPVRGERGAPTGCGLRATAGEEAPLAEPPAATEKTREQKRFARYDKDRNGTIAKEEYLAARRKAFAKLDLNGDGTLSFDEYAVKTSAKFTKADGDRSGTLNPAEFATTRVVRKSRPRPNCPPAARPAPDDEG